jgi:hypothetical protein
MPATISRASAGLAPQGLTGPLTLVVADDGAQVEWQSGWALDAEVVAAMAHALRDLSSSGGCSSGADHRRTPGSVLGRVATRLGGLERHGH